MTSPKAPTGRKTTAQGKEHRDAALGSPPPQIPSPEGAGHLPAGWIETELGQVADSIQYGHTAKSSSETIGPRFLRITDIQDGGVDWSTVPYCDIDHREIARYRLITDDLVFARTGATVGKSFLIRGEIPESVFASYLIRVRLSGALVPHFTYYSFQSGDYWRQISDSSSGIRQPNVNGTKLAALRLPLPPLAEQNRIVSKIEELFSELDAGEESLRRARRQLGVYRQSLLKQAFEGKLTAPWRKQNPHLLESPDQLLARIQAERQARYEEELKAWEAAMKQREKEGDEDKRPSKPKRPAPPARIHIGDDDDLYDLPDGWAWLSFDSACYESVLGKMLDNAKNRGEPKPYLRNINVRWGRFDLSDLLDIRIEQSEIGRYRAEAGDLIICEGGEPGRCAVWPTYEHREVFLQKALHRVRFTDCVSPYFVQLLMSLTASTKRLEKYFTGTTIKHLTGTGLSGVPIPLCCLPEQREIVRLLDEQFSVIEQNEREIDAALKRSAALRQSILKKAFTGQLVPQDPTDEPASVLLARIQTERNTAAKTPKKKAAQVRKSNS